MQRIQIVMLAVDDKVILGKAFLLNSAGIVVVIAVDETVDIHQSRSSIENDIKD